MKNGEVAFMFGVMFFLVTLFLGFHFKDSIVEIFHPNEKIEQLEEEENADAIISKAFNKKYVSLYQDIPFVYDVKASWDYDTYENEELQKTYLKKVQSPDWDGAIPARVTIHIREEWKNTNRQKEQIFELIERMKKYDALSGQVVFNPTVDLEGIDSKVFVIGKKSYYDYLDNQSSPLVFFKDISRLEDIEKTNRLYDARVDEYSDLIISGVSRFDGSFID